MMSTEVVGAVGQALDHLEGLTYEQLASCCRILRIVPIHQLDKVAAIKAIRLTVGRGTFSDRLWNFAEYVSHACDG